MEEKPSIFEEMNSFRERKRLDYLLNMAQYTDQDIRSALDRLGVQAYPLETRQDLLVRLSYVQYPRLEDALIEPSKVPYAEHWQVRAQEVKPPWLTPAQQMQNGDRWHDEGGQYDSIKHDGKIEYLKPTQLHAEPKYTDQPNVVNGVDVTEVLNLEDPGWLRDRFFVGMVDPDGLREATQLEIHSIKTLRGYDPDSRVAARVVVVKMPGSWFTEEYVTALIAQVHQAALTGNQENVLHIVNTVLHEQNWVFDYQGDLVPSVIQDLTDEELALEKLHPPVSAPPAIDSRPKLDVADPLPIDPTSLPPVGFDRHGQKMEDPGVI